MSSEKLPILKVNETVTFFSPLDDDIKFVRTGTIGDGSCCYHAVLHACSRSYARMDLDARKDYVAKLRRSISGGLNKKKWEQLSDGLVAKIPFQENVNKILNKIYSGQTPSKLNKEAVSIILEMVSMSDFEKVILPSAYEDADTVSDCKKSIVKQAVNFYEKLFKKMESNIDVKKVDYCISTMRKLLEIVADKAEHISYENYLNSITDTKENVDRYTLDLISKRLDRNIFFIDSKTRMPYQEGGHRQYKKRKSVILMWIADSHYEVVGCLQENNRVQREFSFDDPLIVKIYTFLCNPKKVPKTFPMLIPYLPKEIRDKYIRSPFFASPPQSPSSFQSPQASPSPSPRTPPSESHYSSRVNKYKQKRKYTLF